MMKAAAAAERSEFEQGTIEALRVMLCQLKPPTMKLALQDFGLQVPADEGRIEMAHMLTEALVRSAQREVLETGDNKEN